MRFTTYTKYKGSLLDALNLENLLEHLSDFLMDGGFAGGPHYHPYWGWSGAEDTNSMDALKRALLEALIESGQLTPEMLEELRGEGEGDADVQREIAELLDDLIQKMVEQGYLTLEGGSPPDAGRDAGRHRPGRHRRGQAGGPDRQVQPDPEGHGLPGLPGPQGAPRPSASPASAVHDTPHLATGVEAEAASQPLRVRRHHEPGHPRHAQERHRARGAAGAAQPRVRRPHGAPGGVPLLVRHRAHARRRPTPWCCTARTASRRPRRWRWPCPTSSAPSSRATPSRCSPSATGPRRSPSPSSPRRRWGRSTPTRPRASRWPAGSSWRRRRTCARSS